MAFLNEQGLQHLVDKINVRSSKTLPDNAPDGTIIIDPDECSKGFNVSMDVDTALSATSTNPVQNKVIKEALDGKLGKNETAARATQDGAGNTISTTYASKADVSALLSTKLGVTAIAYAATRDGAGNNIVDTYAKKTDIPNITVDAELSDTSTNPIQNKAVKTAIDTVTASIPTKVSTLENDAGYLTQHQSLDNYAKTNQDNNFSALQTFPGIRTSMEDMLYQWNTTTPTKHCGFMIVSANTTIDLSKIFEALPKAQYMAVYTCFIQASSDYSLTITGVSNIYYIGSASDCSIKAPGVLLNVLCWRSGEQGQYTSACVSVSACS